MQGGSGWIPALGTHGTRIPFAMQWGQKKKKGSCYKAIPKVLLLFSHCRVQLFVAPGMAAHQASLSFTISRSLLKLMSIESVMPSNHLVLCCHLLLLPSIFPSINPKVLISHIFRAKETLAIMVMEREQDRLWPPRKLMFPDIRTHSTKPPS